MEKIGTQHGIEGTRRKLQALDPAPLDVPAYNRLLGEPGVVYPGDALPAEGTVQKIVNNVNELIDRVEALEARPSVPFPFQAPS